MSQLEQRPCNTIHRDPSRVSFVLARLDVQQRALKVFQDHFRRVYAFDKARRGARGRVEVGCGNCINVGGDEFDEGVDIFGCDLRENKSRD